MFLEYQSFVPVFCSKHLIQSFCSMGKASFSEKSKFAVALRTLKFLVSFLDTELKKLTFGSEESLTPRKFSELEGSKRRFLKSSIVYGVIFWD